MRSVLLVLINISIVLTTVVLIPFASSFEQRIYSGSVSFIQFNDDGSFIFQLVNKGNIVVVNRPNCEINNMFLVKKHRKYISYDKLNRMRNDIRDVFLNKKQNLTVSVSIFACDENSRYPMVNNLMLGKQKNK